MLTALIVLCALGFLAAVASAVWQGYHNHCLRRRVELLEWEIAILKRSAQRDRYTASLN